MPLPTTPCGDGDTLGASATTFQGGGLTSRPRPPANHVPDKHVFPDPADLHVGPAFTVWTASRLIALIEATNPGSTCLLRQGSEHRGGIAPKLPI